MFPLYSQSRQLRDSVKIDTTMEAAEDRRSFYVLVIECQPRVNWYEMFEGCELPNGCRVQVEQATFQQISMTVYPSGPLVVELAAADKPHPGTPQVLLRLKLVLVPC